MEKINNYWVDSNNNRWSAIRYSEEQALEYSDSLQHCSNCTNCKNCIGCNTCLNCEGCQWCSMLCNCIDCDRCHHMNACNRCNYCAYCDCCDDCTGCKNCAYCSNFTKNPERIVSGKIGSRKANTTYYWTKDQEQVICGCFTGTLQQFEDRVKEIHKDNIYAIEYMDWIRKVKLYKGEVPDCELTSFELTQEIAE